METLIIAAGRGSRLDRRFYPKPLIPVLRLSLLERIILSSKLASINRFKIVVGYMAEIIIKKIGSGYKHDVHIDYIFNPDWERGNGISVYRAKDYFKENFILLMSDHLFDDSILRKLQQIDLEEDCCVLCVDYKLNSDHFNFYDATKVWVENGRVKRIGKHLEQFNAIDAGMFLCSPVIFDALGESISQEEYSLSAGNQVLSNWGKLKILDISDHFWIDVDDKESLRKAKKMLMKRAMAIKQSLFGKKVKFWFIDRDGRYELTGVVTEHIVAENCLTVQDDKKGLKYYLGIDRIQVIQ